MEEVILPIRVAKFLGCHTAILTNAAGGINHDFHLGDLMLITGVWRGGGGVRVGGDRGGWRRGSGWTGLGSKNGEGVQVQKGLGVARLCVHKTSRRGCVVVEKKK
jgi:hypothetical protein